MGYKNIMISNPVDLSIKNEQLIISTEKQVSIPLEDINSILIEEMTVKLSVYFIQALGERGIVLYVCDKKHIPNAVLLPLVKHSRHYKMLKNQLNISKPFQKRLWQQIVIQKIQNQAKCLELQQIDGFKELYAMCKEVQSGDKTHVEAKAAAFYFRRLFGMGFYRDKDHIINSALNYGYAIIRGMIAKSIICYGFEPSIGLCHHSVLNSYNLADDFIEPFRPIVDLYVASRYSPDDVDVALTPEIKRGLFSILSYDMQIQKEIHSVSNSIDKMIMSYSGCMCGNCQELLLPKLLEIQYHQYE